jgi:hypothetical protein
MPIFQKGRLRFTSVLTYEEKDAFDSISSVLLTGLAVRVTHCTHAAQRKHGDACKQETPDEKLEPQIIYTPSYTIAISTNVSYVFLRFVYMIFLAPRADRSLSKLPAAARSMAGRPAPTVSSSHHHATRAFHLPRLVESNAMRAYIRSIHGRD